jgi:hypothetical protein
LNVLSAHTAVMSSKRPSLRSRCRWCDALQRNAVLLFA